eukprot:TRINITY_DN23893_c0_g1_i2.p1 TRINITY_DN23893_c0_g1~~TRINITY_DN23893_c0_g1_i2.p1  ORF type:complete len:112 (+),score=14.33 TRINITY_DN23893_c0_g1_i2:50-337(+)
MAEDDAESQPEGLQPLSWHGVPKQGQKHCAAALAVAAVLAAGVVAFSLSASWNAVPASKAGHGPEQSEVLGLWPWDTPQHSHFEMNPPAWIEVSG